MGMDGIPSACDRAFSRIQPSELPYRCSRTISKENSSQVHKEWGGGDGSLKVMQSVVYDPQGPRVYVSAQLFTK